MYKCDQCGACCKGHLIVEADQIDLLREPRIVEADPHYAGRAHDSVLHELQSDFEKVIILACGRPCALLSPDNTCSIHPTRPNVCVAMQPGDEQCQSARRAEGLPSLEPTSDADQSESPL